MIRIIQIFFVWGKKIQKYSAWWLGVFLCGALGIILFREFYYFGTLNLYISEPQTRIVIQNKEYKCQEYFCSFSLSPGEYTVFIEKKGFQPEVFSFVLSLQSVSEHTIQLIQNEVSLTPFTPLQKQYSGQLFPLSDSFVFDSVPFLRVKKEEDENYVLEYKTTPVAQFPSPVLVSTDEAGRRAWVVSKRDVSEFLFLEKVLYPVQKYDNDIQFFRPLGDNWYAFQNTENKWFSVFERQKIPLYFSPYSEHTFCGISQQRFIFLKYDEYGVGLFEYRTDTQETRKLHTLEKMPLNDSVFVQCSGRNMEVYVDENTAFRLSF